MHNLAYSIIITLLHSLWQMAILLLFYQCIKLIFTKWPPIAKRNLLYSLLAVQLFTSIITFFLLYLGRQQVLLNTEWSLQWLSPATTLSQQWFSALLVVYVAGFAYKLLGNYLKWKKHISQLRPHFQKAPASIRLFTEQKALAFGIKRKVEVWFSAHISSPLTYGFFKPVILFPVALCNQLSLSQTEALIVHELTHIRTKDYLLNWMLVITESIYFFNPFVKIIAANIRIEREKNCDVKVIDFNYSSLQYAEALLQIAHNTTRPAPMSIAAVRSKEELFKRIQYFSVETNTSKKNVSTWPVVSFVITGFLFLNFLLFNLMAGNSNKKELLANFPIVLHTGNAERNTNELFTSFVTEGIEPAIAGTPVTAVATATNAREKRASQDNPSLTEETESINTDADIVETIPASYVHPIALVTEPAPEVREMIITEENSSGEKVTKSYTVVLENGEWKIQPQWMYTEKQLTDSLKAAIKLDSTILKVFPTIQ